MANIKNEEIMKMVEKAITTADIASSGKLNSRQADRFIDYVIDETSLKNNVRVVRFRNEDYDIDKIGIGTRAAMPATEATDPGLRRGINTSKVTLTPKEIIVPVELSDTFKEINLEGEQVEDHIMQMFARQLGNDLELLALNGNALGPAITQNEYTGAGSTTQYVKDGYYGLFDGWNLLADGGSSHSVDAAGASIGMNVFSQAIRAMPTKFRKNYNRLRFVMSANLYQIYIDKLATRATLLGDKAVEGQAVSPYGIPIMVTPLWDFQPPVTEHIVLSGTTAVSLKSTNVTNVVVLPNTLDTTPTTPYVSGTDYTLDAAAGTIARDGGGSIGDGDTVKVTYDAAPQLILTHMDNLILGIGRDIRLEKDRDIFKRVNQFAMTTKISVQIEETDALVKVKNISATA